MNWNSLNDLAVVQEIGKRLKEYRLKRRLTQQELAEQAGISIFSVAQISHGKAVSITTILPVLRVLRLLENLELLLPEIGLSPVELLKLKGKTPKRIRRKKAE